MAKQTKLQVFCGWCGKYMGSKDGQGETEAIHGICPKCLKKELPLNLYAEGGKVDAPEIL